MSTRTSVAIVGGGVAGALTAIHLARTTAAPNVVLIDRAGAFARGVAYSTRSDSHVLNVPAARLSVFPDDPEHFLRWARRRCDADVAPDAFLPRSLFGDYVAETLAASSVRSDRRVVRFVRRAATDVEPGSPCTVRCDDGSTIVADHVVVALGNSTPKDPPVDRGAAFYASARYTVNPWDAGALESVAADAAVLLIGSGLTMLDVALALRDRGHTGPVHALSRRGLLPRPHADAPLAPARRGPAPEHWLGVEPTMRALLRAVRVACEETGDWHAVVDSLRAVTAGVWGRLDARERTRFLARLQPFWDVHRHRAPLAVHRRIAQLLATGSLQLHAGRIRAWQVDGTGVTAMLDGGLLRVAHVVNCTGPNTDVRRSADPLVRALLARRLIVRDAHGLGVETTADGALIDAAGRPSACLSTVGTWRRAGSWESVAVPELRTQAAALARRLGQTAPAHAGLPELPSFPDRLTSEAVAAVRSPGELRPLLA